MGFITAGGRSSRMGRDKAWLELRGRPMIEYVIDALRPVISNLAIIANHEDYKKLGYRVFADTQEGIGPLEAIRTALVNSATPDLLLVGCDMPFVSPELFRLLIGLAQENRSEDQGGSGKEEDFAMQAMDSPLAIVPLNEEGKPEPLCAVYSIQALPSVTRLIDRGVRKVSDLFAQTPTRFVGFDELRDLQNSLHFFKNVNTPEDFETAKKIISTGF
jgi:molybdopterin-guanine dinucleotide biosynthesis protein A